MFSIFRAMVFIFIAWSNDNCLVMMNGQNLDPRRDSGEFQSKNVTSESKLAIRTAKRSKRSTDKLFLTFARIRKTMSQLIKMV